MIKVNQFYWELYKSSEQGKNTIADFNSLTIEYSFDNLVDFVIKYDPDYRYNSTQEELCYRFEDVIRALNHFDKDLDYSTKEKCRKSAEKLFDAVTPHLGQGMKDPYRMTMSSIIPISLYLQHKNPDYFIPYLFLIRYRYLHQILSDYSIDINEVNEQFGYRERTFFYLDLCDALYDFRMLNKFTPAELCAFLYDMEKKFYDSDLVSEYTQYPRVWLLVGGKSPQEVEAEKMFWQGNSEIKKGDICVFYENSYTCVEDNKSALTGIWIAQSDGHVDPFFFYYQSVLIGDEHKLNKPLPFKKLSTDSRTVTLPHLGAKLCGAGGSELSSILYEEGILPLVKEWDKDFDDSTLPNLYHPELPQDSVEDRGEEKPEKWVEEHRIKPLLANMGLVEKKDYLQQVYLQLGRDKEEGERVQTGKTDFSVFPFGNTRKGEAKCADVLIEAKNPWEMSNPKEIEKTFWQAESYASRQYAQLLIITDGKQFIIYPRTKEGIFRYSEPDSKVEQYSWDELSNTSSDAFKKFRTTILSYKKHSKK